MQGGDSEDASVWCARLHLLEIVVSYSYTRLVVFSPVEVVRANRIRTFIPTLPALPGVHIVRSLCGLLVLPFLFFVQPQSLYSRPRKWQIASPSSWQMASPSS